jgi:hypothetical protein
MLPTTIDLLKAGLKSDPTVSASDRIRLLAMLRAGSESQFKAAPPNTGPRVIRRREAANRLACCVRVIDRLAQQGVLKKVRLPGRTRAAGFLEADVDGLLLGKQAA